MTTTATQQTDTRDAYCPHCHLLIERGVAEAWPQQPMRCPHCRLLVGQGRARPTPAAEPGARGSAAGVFAHEAKRGGGDRSISAKSGKDAIRRVGGEAGGRPEGLLRVDYQPRASAGASLPPPRPGL